MSEEMQCYLANEPVSENVFNTFREVQKQLQASQDEAEKDFKKLAEMTRMYLDLKEVNR